MGKFIDYTGQRFGRYVLIERYKKPGESHAMYLCKCDCGIEKMVLVRHLQSGVIKSCGCHRRETRWKHSDSRTKLYRVWASMISRTLDKNQVNYYGRGIIVCEEWRTDFTTFRAWALENGYSPKLSIDRKNNDGNYEPDNCRWATRKEQNFNKQDTIRININGEILNTGQVCERYGLHPSTLWHRINKGKPVKELIKPGRKR